MAKHTLVVDDDPIVLFLMKKLMQRTGFSQDVDYFEHSPSAMEALRQTYHKGGLYIILLDISMPEMSGWEFLEELGSFASVDNTYVFIITSSTNEDDMVKAEKDPFVRKLIVKPILAEKLSEIKHMIPG